MSPQLSYFVPGKDRAKHVFQLFQKIARRYDLINDLQSLGLHRQWKRQVVHLLQPRPDQTLLDACCGTGDVTLFLAEKCSQVLGIDFSDAMLQIARKRTHSSPHPPHYLQGDVLQLPFEKETFHGITLCYGLRNLADFQQGLQELWRVLRPEGTLIVLDFDQPENRFIRSLYFAYLHFIVPLFGWILCRDSQAYAYILESLKRYPGTKGFQHFTQSTPNSALETKHILFGTMSLHRLKKTSPDS